MVKLGRALLDSILEIIFNNFPRVQRSVILHYFVNKSGTSLAVLTPICALYVKLSLALSIV